MAHQLDFHVTLWSDDQPQLLVLERLLQAFNAEGSPKLIKELKLELLINYLRLYEPLLTDIDVHSIDINWDDGTDEEDPFEQQDRLKLPTFEQKLGDRTYLDPYKYDDVQANDIEDEYDTPTG